MIGIVVATHGKMSSGMKDAVNVIVGQAEGIETCSLVSGASVDEFGATIKEAIEKVNEDSGVIVLTDLVSASPYNQSMLAVNQLPEALQEKVYIIGGVNLPMLLETVNHQLIDTPIVEAVAAITAQGKNSIDIWNIQNIADEEEDDGF